MTIGLLMVRSMLVRTQQLVASGQVPVSGLADQHGVRVPSVMSAMLTAEFWYMTPLS